jgi:hypothetical protein
MSPISKTSIAGTPIAHAPVRRSPLSPAYYLGGPPELWLNGLIRHREQPATARSDEAPLERRPAA